ncbi:MULTISPECIES: tRNA 2-thiouridine(34) synthase MnmA [Methylobacillus]|uniref:tRNA-specific 2-thiouridylase MnmA n=1 Tax=Methylobacillus flagellatus (strain ATCC 51484 / DSM 6875 / VKM B-1610 / KT) TaxID=265072 RepID=MNMA_METFK|nr:MULTISPECIES: tRNA 2-thiouridine(34) synthase MnmA [Methylobacillus]Q1GZF5.1 RecName: Full=tRNA-specific 2-thiouridylase MnmA [Methylobacillus flagellatus KT]ABE50382.1 tRNA (5-methylaminomethyl-2-thiouridylate)-methyltransferase [Methylobacillus flagellatus KT]
MKKKVIVGMSGGVDSSVAALLLKEQGYEVVGLFMKNWEDDDTDEYCPAKQDLIDAAAVADKIGIELEAVNFSKEYKERVFANFLEEYSAGRTPNPDILCNSEIKFKAFLDHAMALGGDLMATGHYAQVREKNGLFQLMKADDGTKDQSYFLYRLNQAQLSKTLFPLGHLLKREIRDIARRAGLPTSEKKDSTGICFIGERPFQEFLSRYLPRAPGEIQTPEGKVVGQHHGLMYYTMGQRQGLGIGGSKDSNGEPWFVAGKDMQRNVLIVVQGHDHPLLLNDGLIADNLHWIAGEEPKTHWVYAAKTRYRQPDAPCEIDRLDSGTAEIRFGHKQWAITPGQSVVVYESNVCLGGGIITSAL